jgi:hypothetical protein
MLVGGLAPAKISHQEVFSMMSINSLASYYFEFYDNKHDNP